jgi:hypothetical protein
MVERGLNLHRLVAASTIVEQQVSRLNASEFQPTTFSLALSNK